MEICVVMILKRPFLCRAYFFSLNIDGTEKGALREAVCPTNGSFDAGKGFILLCWTHCLSHALRHTYLFFKNHLQLAVLPAGFQTKFNTIDGIKYSSGAL